MFVPLACSTVFSPASLNTFSQAATYEDNETPTPIGTMHKSRITFMPAIRLPSFRQCPAYVLPKARSLAIADRGAAVAALSSLGFGCSTEWPEEGNRDHRDEKRPKYPLSQIPVLKGLGRNT